MRNYNTKTNSKSSFHRLMAATLTIGGISLLSPMFVSAQSLTPAGTGISNTATGTYVDPNDPNTTLNTTSNTVTVTVAEVAGITLVATGVPVDTTSPGDAIKVGDTIAYTFTITNVGNDATQFRIPDQATTTGPGTALPNLEYSYDGINFLPIDGATTVDPTGTDSDTQYITAPIDVGGTIQVRVKVLVTAGAVNGDVITVQLGNTTGSPGSQNVALINNGGDVYTVDDPDVSSATVPKEILGAPVNGDREASATQDVTVGAVTKNLALATVLKIRGANAYTNVAPANTILGDTVEYDLSLRVEDTDVTGQGITPQPLAGYANISVDASTATNYILISDVIPTGTVLSATAPVAPSGWTTVYSSVAPSANPNLVAWSTVAPTTLGERQAVTRVGFIKSTDAAPGTPDPTKFIPIGTTEAGFKITVEVGPGPTEPTAPLSINNIAQLVGQTPDGGVSVYDESGDVNPNNYSGNPGSMTPGSTDANSDGVPDNGVASASNGVANPTTQGVDSGNNNTGSGDGGEVNVLVISPQVAESVLNGPLNAPTATGPDGTTATDFTNKSSLIEAGLAPNSTIDPSAVAFGNTVQNNGTDTNPATVTIEPVNLLGSAALDLPNGTKVTITYTGGQTAVYNYVYNNGGTPLVTTDDTGTFTLTSGSAISVTGVAANASINYGVEVDLPSGTKLSTDLDDDYTGDTEWGYPVPIKATIGAAENITIDRVYTGYLRLLKVSRVLQGTGPAVQGTDGTFSTDAPPNQPKKAAPGNIIEYQVQYSNISSGQSGSGSVILNAANVVITEDGMSSIVAPVNTNNWADVAVGSGIIFTSNVVAPQAADSNGGAITFFPSGNQSGTTQATDVTKYVNTLPTAIAPQGNGTFTFQRKVN